MDRGLFSTSKPSDRRVINRSEPTPPRQQDQNQNSSEPTEPPKSNEPSNSRDSDRSNGNSRGNYQGNNNYNGRGGESKRSSKRWLVWVIIVVLVAVGVAGWAWWSRIQNASPAVDSDKYQAVSFTDGQLYFGKLSVINDGYFKLSDVYYLQPQSGDSTDTGSVQNATNNQNNFKLIKFTDVIYGPEDAMIIPKNQVLFYENLQPDGKVTQLINEYNK